MKFEFTPELLDRLRTNDPALTALDLSDSGVTDEQLVLLCQALTQNTVLTSLNLGYNKIGAAGAAALAENTTLTSLDLRENNIRTAGIKALTKNLTLTEALVNFNRAPQAQIEKLFLRVDTNRYQQAQREGQSFVLVEHVNAPLPSAQRFSLTFHPTSPQRPRALVQQ